MANKMKDPAVNWYFGNYYNSTRLMTQAERGAYMDVLAYLFEHGHLEHAQVVQACEGHIYPRVFAKLTIDKDGLYFNQRLEFEIEKRRKNYETKFNNLGGYIKNPPLKGKGKKAETAENEEKPPPEPLSTQGESKNTKAPREPAVKFKPPSVEEVTAYCNERKNGIDPISFLNHYETVGWRYGNGTGKPVKSWQACIRTWEDRRKKDSSGIGEHGQRPGQNFVSGKVPASFKK
jgi:hypothetical protein